MSMIVCFTAIADEQDIFLIVVIADWAGIGFGSFEVIFHPVERVKIGHLLFVCDRVGGEEIA